MRAFLAAVSMLSILPVGSFTPTEQDLRKMVNYYPWAGLLFALLFWGIGFVLQKGEVPSMIAAVMLAILPEVLTKGFHLDGLADTADAFLSGRSRERKLEIMRDSHIGTMGVLGIVALLGLKFACFASIPSHLFPAAAALMILSGRCGIVWYVAVSRYARPQGLGALSFSSKPYWGGISGMILLVLSCCFLGKWMLLLIPLLLLITMLIWSRITYRVIGGATGDTIGCAEEIAEAIALLLFVFL